jgi:hypothetical protein
MDREVQPEAGCRVQVINDRPGAWSGFLLPPVKCSVAHSSESGSESEREAPPEGSLSAGHGSGGKRESVGAFDGPNGNSATARIIVGSLRDRTAMGRGPRTA